MLNKRGGLWETPQGGLRSKCLGGRASEKSAKEKENAQDEDHFEETKKNTCVEKFELVLAVLDPRGRTSAFLIFLLSSFRTLQGGGSASFLVQTGSSAPPDVG